MKRCPTCEKTFDDSMRFCQSDGTPLVEDEAPLDPYKTMMARPGDFAEAAAPSDSQNKEDEELLQLPAEQSDPLYRYTSEGERRQGIESRESDKDQVIDLPPLAPEPPKFNEPSLIPPSFSDISPPPLAKEDSGGKSPFNSSPPPSPFEMTTPPVPSPFSKSKQETYEAPASNFPQYAGPETADNAASFIPFDQPSATGLPAPQTNWQNRDVTGQNKPFQTPKGTAEGENQTLAIVSLILGIVSIVFCQVTGPVAIVTGFMARRKAEENPSEYGGAGLGLAGIITGAIGTLLLVLLILYLIFFFGAIGASFLGS